MGLPGETLRISQGKLYVNDKPVVLSNRDGEIDFTQQHEYKYLVHGESLPVPMGHFFVIADNIENSADSRLWGPISEGSVKGRVVFCYWPWQDAGATK